MNKADREKLAYKVQRAKELKKAKKVKIPYNILALDPATKMGWCMNLKEYGVWDLSKKKNENDGFKWLQFENRLERFMFKHDIRVVAMELPVIHHVGATIHHSKLNAIIEYVCAKLNVEYKKYTPSEIKKWATLKGNAKKGMVIEAAKKHLGYEGNDDNEADAIWIYMMLKRDLS